MKQSGRGICNSLPFQKQAISISADL